MNPYCASNRQDFEGYTSRLRVRTILFLDPGDFGSLMQPRAGETCIKKVQRRLLRKAKNDTNRPATADLYDTDTN